MFLDVIRRRNPRLIEQAIALHQAGELPANAYVIDLDAVELNARAIAAEAAKYDLTVLAMTKQMGRNASFCRAVMRGGVAKAVAVDMGCARAVHRAGMEVGHIGHLSQIPRHEAEAAAAMAPDYWTVFNVEKAKEAGAAARKRGHDQPLMARIRAEGDRFYRGHEGGFPASDIAAVADALDRTPGGRFAGITTFPALLFDSETRKVKPTPNLETLRRAAEALADAGRGRSRSQRARHHVVGDGSGVGRGGRHADRARARTDGNDAATCGRGPARNPGRGLSDGSFASRGRRSASASAAASTSIPSFLTIRSGRSSRMNRRLRSKRCGTSRFRSRPPSTITG